MLRFIEDFFVIFIALIIIGGFIGCGVAFVLGNGDLGLSAGTGWGCLGGLVAAIMFAFVQRQRESLNQKARR